MSATRLVARRVEKPWGRRDLPPSFEKVPAGGAAVGEIWFEDPSHADRALLVKYLFTSEKLSIQVHPDDADARAAGYPCGKDEAWVVLAADEDAVIGIGLKESTSREALREAALDGRIVDMVDWRPSSAGDVYYSPAGTIHALGQGLTVIEIQQNLDLTYRLYDYGRPRELHLDAGIAVAVPAPYVAPFAPREIGEGRLLLAEGPAFVLERWTGSRSGTLRADAATPVWVVPVSGAGTMAGQAIEAGGAWILEGEAALEMEAGADMLIAYPAATWMRDLLT